MTLREKATKFMFHGVTLGVLSALSVLAPLVYYSFRFGWVYVDQAVFDGFCLTLFCLMMINALLGAAIDVCKIYHIECRNIRLLETKWVLAAAIVHGALTCLFAIVALVFVAVAGAESASVGFRFIGESLPAFAAAYGAVVLALFLPKVANRKLRAAVAAITVFVTVVAILGAVFPCTPYRILSHPIVIDNGRDYSVVFATNDIGTGYIEYTYDGTQYKVYDENNGRLNGDSCIHTIRVPYEHLEDNAYRVGTRRVIDELSYGGRTGAERVSDEYRFASMKGDAEQNYLMISDWHTHTRKAKKAIDCVGAYGGVIMLGDSSPGLNFEEEVSAYIVEFGGEITQGRMPIVFARGNHETRGPYAGKLADDLGMDKYYYTVDTGDYTFLVLDSGEDKQDDHPEYGGMVDYAQYRRQMVEWLERAPIDRSDRIVALVHSSEIAIEEDLRDRAYRRLTELGVQYVFSGHTHLCGVTESYAAGMITYEDGGFDADRFIASKIVLRGDAVDIQAWNDKGQLVFDNAHRSTTAR